MLQVRLATAPKVPAGKLSIRLDGPPSLGGTLYMPPAGQAIAYDLSAPSDASFKLKIHFHRDNHRVAVELGKVRDGDSLSIFVSQGTPPFVPVTGALYTGSLTHGDGRKEPCDLKCENGVREEDECCVNCREGDEVVARVCC
jgi:hypothetical protein